MALILRRRVNEEIRIGNAVVRITQIKGSKVQVAVEAPKDVPIVRGELPRKDAA